MMNQTRVGKGILVTSSSRVRTGAATAAVPAAASPAGPGGTVPGPPKGPTTKTRPPRRSSLLRPCFPAGRTRPDGGDALFCSGGDLSFVAAVSDRRLDFGAW